MNQPAPGQTANPELNRRLKKLGLVHNNTTFYKYWRALAIEYVAATLFVFVACGSVVAQNVYDVPTSAQTLVAGIVQGFAIAALVYTCGPSSGGHINPAVTLGLVITGDFTILDGIGYVFAQVVGGITGAGLLAGVLQDNLEGNLGTTTLGHGTTPFQGYIFEVIVTFLLLFTIFGSSANKRNGVITSLAPIPIGFSVTAGVTIAFGFTGGSLNPARTFGPALISGTWTHHYVYWFGPFTGAIISALVYRYILKRVRTVVAKEEATVEVQEEAQLQHRVEEAVQEIREEIRRNSVMPIGDAAV